MKTKVLIALTFSLASGVVMNAMGQFGQPVRASEIMGRTINDMDGQKLGSLKDFAVDLENGRVVEAVVAHGGFLGIDSKLAAVPPQNFIMENGGNMLRLSMTPQRLDGAPGMDLSKWQDSVTQSRIEAVYQYYDVTPYFLIPEHQSHNANNPVMVHLGDVERASHLLGLQAMNRQDQALGKVNDIIVDFSQGRIVEVVISSGQFLGMPDELSAMPPQVLHFDTDRQLVTVDTTKAALASSPHFSSHAWPVLDRHQADDVYQAYHVVPYFLPFGFDSAAQNVPVGNKNLAPLEQGTSPADLNITASIQKEIMNASDLSIDAKAVKVITVNGHVTLRGQVDSQTEKNRLSDIAARIVPASEVDNQLEVKQNTASAAL